MLLGKFSVSLVYDFSLGYEDVNIWGGGGGVRGLMKDDFFSSFFFSASRSLRVVMKKITSTHLFAHGTKLCLSFFSLFVRPAIDAVAVCTESSC